MHLAKDDGSRAPLRSPSARDVGACMPERSRIRSTLKGLTLFSGGFCFYAATLLGFIVLPGWPLKSLCALLNSGSMAVLYFVAHDACHGSLTPSRLLNRLLGRLAFLPSLHSYSFWVVSHNYLHHGFTNLRGKDHVWAPLSKEEFDSLSWVRRALERLYRTALGVGLYYLVELWWKHLACPRRRDWARVANKLTAAADQLSVLGFVGLQVAGLCACHDGLTRGLTLPTMSRPMLLLGGLVFPWLLLNWTAGLVTFVHHTHPRVRWFAGRKEWCFYNGHLRGTVHLTLPWPLGVLLHHVMEHTAHHVDTRIPLYHLAVCQRRLEEAYPDVIVQRFSWGNFRSILSACQLYDYENHRWLDFRGNPTTEPNGPRHAGGVRRPPEETAPGG